MVELCEFSDNLHAEKYRGKGESFRESINRMAGALSDSQEHYHQLQAIWGQQRHCPGGRIQQAAGSPRKVTANNCNVSRTIRDSLAGRGGILDSHWEAMVTMKYGAGIGMNFSSIRPRGSWIKTQETKASGPVSFMGMWDAGCETIRSAGHRRGAMMAVLNIDHPDILEFVRCKQNETKLTGFNISIGMTDEFMVALEEDGEFNLRFGGKVYEKVKARPLWEIIMQNAWDWSEPGILFLDRINKWNNLWYCEKIAATNPCGEQPLPPYGSCLLGSFNIANYVSAQGHTTHYHGIDYDQLRKDVYPVVRAFDNLIDLMHYPLDDQEEDAKNKRRMGLGVMGLANAVEACGDAYGSSGFLACEAEIFNMIRNAAYEASVRLAQERGPFPLFKKEEYLQSPFVQTLPKHIQEGIAEHGIRNSHLLSVAPTGTISFAANYVSSGIEPVIHYECDRTVQTFDGPVQVRVQDYGYKHFGIKGKLAQDVTLEEHMAVQQVAQQYVDSAVSKTINFWPSKYGPDFYKDEFHSIYVKAWKGDLKGITVHNYEGKRAGLFKEVKTEDQMCVLEGKECG